VIFFVWFGFYKKSNQTDLKKTKIGSNRPVSVRFGFLEQKPVQTGLARLWLGFFLFGSVFSFFFVWIQFGFFNFRLIKPNQTDQLF